MSPARSTWWWVPQFGAPRAVTALNVETNLRVPAPNGPGLFRYDARKIMAEHRAGAVAPIHAGIGWYSYGEEPRRPDVPILERHDPAAVLIRVDQLPRVPDLICALERIRDARDFCADHGGYPDPPAGPDTRTQSFDDWAADVAGAALDAFSKA